jgi:HEPN domain-containing protein
MPHEAGSPEDWLAYARGDLALAQHGDLPGVMYELLCFHAQQAAEKSLKAVLISRGIAFPRTHDLKMLIELLPPKIDRPTWLMDAVILSEYAVIYRYPVISEPITDEE